MRAIHRCKHFISILLSTLLLVSCGGSREADERSLRQFESHLEQARFFQQQGQLRASMDEAKNAIELLPTERAPYFVIARTYLISGDADRALKAYANLLKTAPESAAANDLDRARLGLARSYLLKGDTAAARKRLDQIESDDLALQLEVNELLARIDYEDGLISSARERLQANLRRSPRHAPTVLTLSKLEYFNGRTSTAKSFLGMALEQAPHDTKNLLWNARLLKLEKQYEEARLAYLKALEVIGQVDTMTLEKYQTISEYIIVLGETGREEEAQTYQDILDSSEPGRIRSLMLSGEAAYHQRNHVEAGRLFLQALRSAPSHPEALNWLGHLAWEKGDAQNALRYWQRLPEDTLPEAHLSERLSAQQRQQQKATLRSVADGFYYRGGELLISKGQSHSNGSNLDLGKLPLRWQEALNAHDKGSLTYRRLLRWAADHDQYEAARSTLVALENGGDLIARDCLKEWRWLELTHELKIVEEQQGRELAREHLSAARVSFSDERWEPMLEALAYWLEDLDDQALSQLHGADDSPQIKTLALEFSGDIVLESSSDNARSYYQEAWRHSPSLRLAYKMVSTLKPEDQPRSLSFWLRELTRKHPEDLEARIALAQTYESQANAEAASNQWRTVLAQAPYHQDALVALDTLDSSKPNRLLNDIDELKKAYEQNPTPRLAGHIARRLQSEGSLDEAQQLLASSLEQFPADESLHAQYEQALAPF